jgi:hypothetical protein
MSISEPFDEPRNSPHEMPAGASRSSPRPAVDWPEVHRQLKGKNVTLQLLWEEYQVGSQRVQRSSTRSGDGRREGSACDLARSGRPWRAAVWGGWMLGVAQQGNAARSDRAEM